MTITELATITDTELSVEWNESLSIFQVSLYDKKTGHFTDTRKANGCLTGTWGGGETRELAVESYCKQISGKCLVLVAPSARREYPLPEEVIA